MNRFLSIHFVEGQLYRNRRTGELARYENGNMVSLDGLSAQGVDRQRPLQWVKVP